MTFPSARGTEILSAVDIACKTARMTSGLWSLETVGREFLDLQLPSRERGKMNIFKSTRLETPRSKENRNLSWAISHLALCGSISQYGFFTGDDVKWVLEKMLGLYDNDANPAPPTPTASPAPPTHLRQLKNLRPSIPPPSPPLPTPPSCHHRLPRCRRDRMQWTSPRVPTLACRSRARGGCQKRGRETRRER
ncbi:hypothetical protein B0H10DRAFT_1939155 [Mycena sp. CBHHK59/15]|nr:hypothetical protein B0H10DRAFT_1939155 [Mycena sp. CBHHK59/15]